jgi:hypothetical protein
MGIMKVELVADWNTWKKMLCRDQGNELPGITFVVDEGRVSMVHP